MGLAVTAVVASVLKTNAETSGMDLADLSKMAPRQEYPKESRPTMNFGVTLDLFRVLTFYGNPRLNDALFRVLVVFVFS